MIKFFAYLTSTPQEPQMIDEPPFDSDRHLRVITGSCEELIDAIQKCNQMWEGKTFKVYTYRSQFNPDSFKLVYRSSNFER